MKFILRLIGTWTLGLALVLLIRDIVVSATSGDTNISSLADSWADLHEPSWRSLVAYLENALSPIGGGDLVNIVGGWPAWAVISIFGTILLLAGRKRSGKNFIETN